MTKVFSPPRTLGVDDIPSFTFHQQKDGRKKDGRPRVPKWFAHTSEGTFKAAELLYYLYYGEKEEGTYPLFLDPTPPLDTTKDNLVLLTKRELKNLVHFNNNIYTPHKEINALAVAVVKCDIKRKEVTEHVR